MTGQEIFEAKLRTGQYIQYSKEALDILRADCERQAALARELKEVWANA